VTVQHLSRVSAGMCVKWQARREVWKGRRASVGALARDDHYCNHELEVIDKL
jgi:hypothetical protein